MRMKSLSRMSSVSGSIRGNLWWCRLVRPSRPGHVNRGAKKSAQRFALKLYHLAFTALPKKRVRCMNAASEHCRTGEQECMQDMRSDFGHRSSQAPAMRAILAGFVMVGALSAVSGCARDNDSVDLASYVDSVEPADVLYNQGLANMRSGNLREASAKFAAVDRQHPYSDFARKANVMAAFTSYKMGDHDNAIQAARRFVSLYPTHEDAAYAQYIIGLSYFAQMPVVTRDQRDTRLALQNFNELLERYPDSIYVDDAQARMRILRDQLAGKEMQVGRYYLERREYAGAVTRFRGVVEQYSKTRHVEEALARLTETYLAMGLAAEAQNSAAILGHNFPDSDWYKDSYALLQSGGLEPRENRGSPLSRVTRRLLGS